MKKENKNLKNSKNRTFWKKRWARLVLSVLLGIISGAAYDYLNTNDCQLSVYLLVRMIILSCLYYGLFWVANYVLSKTDQQTKVFNNKITNYLFGKKTSMTKQVLIIATMIFVLWIPYFVVSYPGNLSNDTTGQIPMFFSMVDNGGQEYEMSDQHPVFTTMVFGSVVYIGNMIFHDMQGGIALCIILQMIITAVVFSFAIVWARRKWGTSVWLSVISIGFLTLCPVVPLMVISLSKDTFFSWIYVLFIVAIFELVYQDFLIIKNKKYLAALIALCVGVCLTKKLGIYIVMGTFVAFLIFCRQKWTIRLRMSIPLVISIGLMFVIMPVIIANSAIKPSPTMEMLSIPLQQTALTYVRHEGMMSDEEKEQLNKVFDLTTLKEGYLPYASDPIKSRLREDVDYGLYIKIYLKQFLKYPGAYFDAFASQTAGLFVPYPIAPIFDNHWHTWNMGYFDEKLFDKPEFSAEQSIIMQEYYDWLVNTPILNLTTYLVTYTVFIPALFLIVIMERQKRYTELLAVVPVLMSFAGLIVSGTVYYGNEAMRYVMPFVYTVPVLLAYMQGLIFRERPNRLAKTERLIYKSNRRASAR